MHFKSAADEHKHFSSVPASNRKNSEVRSSKIKYVKISLVSSSF